MDNNNTVGTCDYADILLQTENLINCSFQEIKSKYTGYPHSETNHFEKDKKDCVIEIRFDAQEITMTCTFNAEQICDSIFLFPDRVESNHELISYLEEAYNYNFIDTMWFKSNHYIKIKKITPSLNDVCFMVNAKS